MQIHITRVYLPDWLNPEIMIKFVVSHPICVTAVSVIADAFASTLYNLGLRLCKSSFCGINSYNRQFNNTNLESNTLKENKIVFMWDETLTIEDALMLCNFTSFSIYYNKNNN